MHSLPLSSNSFDILNIPSTSQKFSKEINSKIFHDFSFSRHENELDGPDHSQIFGEKNPFYLQNNIKTRKKRSIIRKFKCGFPHCQRFFISESQLKRHEQSRMAHEKVIYNMVFSKCMSAKSVDDLLEDNNLKEIHKYCPEIFNEIVVNLKNKLKTKENDTLL